jgi:hypothetical protein
MQLKALVIERAAPETCGGDGCDAEILHPMETILQRKCNAKSK